MTYTLIDFHRAFQSVNETLKLSAGAQAVYFSILGRFDAEQFPERVGVSTRELMAMSGLKSTSSVFESRNVLKQKKLIDFHTENGVTVYSLRTEHLPNGNRTATEHLPNGNRTPAEIPNIRVRAHINNEDINSENIQSINKSSINQSARACASAFNWNDENEERLTDLWLGNNGARVTAELLSYLKVLVEKHGVDWTDAIIREAANAYNGQFSMNVNFLRGCVKRKLKGGESSARVAGQSRNNRPNVLRFTGGRAIGNSGGSSASGKGRFDDNPDYA